MVVSTSPFQSYTSSCPLTTYRHCPCLCVYAVVAFALRLLLEPLLMATVVREGFGIAESGAVRFVTARELRGDELAHLRYAWSC